MARDAAALAALSHIGFLVAVAAARWRNAGSVTVSSGAHHSGPWRRLGFGQLRLDLAGARIGRGRRGAAVPFRRLAEAARAKMAEREAVAARIREQRFVV